MPGKPEGPAGANSHYFARRPLAPSEPRVITWTLQSGRTLVFETDRGVFSYRRVDRGTRLLLKSFAPGESRRVVDLGCGYGALGLTLAAAFSHLLVVLVDINERAVALCRRNIHQNGLPNARCLLADGLSAIRPGSLHAVVTNPPVRAGRDVVYSWVTQSRRCLAPGGAFWVVIRTRLGADSLRRRLEQEFGSVDLVARGGGYRVLRAPAADR